MASFYIYVILWSAVLPSLWLIGLHLGVHWIPTSLLKANNCLFCVCVCGVYIIPAIMVETSHPSCHPPTSTLTVDFPSLPPEKLYFKLLQVLHNLDISTLAIHSKRVPPDMVRQAKKLTTFIKPAVPCHTTLAKVAANTQAWLDANL